MNGKVMIFFFSFILLTKGFQYSNYKVMKRYLVHENIS